VRGGGCSGAYFRDGARGRDILLGLKLGRQAAEVARLGSARCCGGSAVSRLFSTQACVGRVGRMWLPSKTHMARLASSVHTFGLKEMCMRVGPEHKMYRCLHPAGAATERLNYSHNIYNTVPPGHASRSLVLY
jgi:hypothetical protein